MRLHVGSPPVIVMEGEHHTVEGPPITAENVEQLLQSVADTRQRRELRERGVVEFIYRFRDRANFVVRARMENETVGLDIH